MKGTNGATAAEPPHSVEAEQATLGSILFDPSACREIAAALEADDFYRPDHRLIAKAIASVAREALPDPVIVAEHLNQAGRLEEAGGAGYLRTLARDTPTAANVSMYAEHVRAYATRRRLLQCAADPARPEDLQATLEHELSRLKASASKTSPVRLPSINFSEMKPHLADGYLIKGFLTPNSLVGIIGQTGSGKTFFATDLAMHLAARRAWRRLNVRGGLVVYGALEGPISAENRFVAARESLHFPGGIPLALTPGPLNLRDPDDATLLVDFVRTAESEYGEKCVAIFVDTLSRALAGGDENGSDDMGALVMGADKVRLATGATLLLVHHLGKDENRGARGWSGLKGALDTEIEVGAREKFHLAVVTKQRDLPGGAQYPFCLKVVELGRDDDGDPVTSCVVEPVEEMPSEGRQQPTGKHQRNVLSALLEWKRQHPEAIFISTVEYRQIAKTQNVDRRRLQDVTEGLERFGWIHAIAGGYKLPSEEDPS